ncbi:hypothetical protein PHMEG_00029510 [Phytophthora megakarya]|uniref:Reverse transcriptase/retrotransposon-derived protein RNase H-like domain-containing protein n=1 Tax=Phytophthora megakarya TaxID=4795 RepID=A0A225V4Y7_9STRA|nr:hypothetical protein PHMEG_00029510 [Phytophthora megakarya]
MRISVSFTKSIFCQSKVDLLSHEISPEWIKADGKKMAAITELSFPKTKRGMQQFLGALNYYSRFIQDFAVFGAALYQLKDEDFETESNLSAAKESFRVLQRKVAEAPILMHFDDKKKVHVMLYANEWALSATLMQMHDDKLHPVQFCGRILKDAEMNYHSTEKEVLALLLLLKVCYPQLTGKTLHVYTIYSTLAWVHKSKALLGRAVQFAVLLSPWQLEVQRIREKDSLFSQLLRSTITNFVDLDKSLALVTPPTKGSPSTRIDPSLLYAQLPHDYDGLVVSFDGSAKTEKNGGYGSCSWIVWNLPEWHIVIAASAYREVTTVNMAEYNGMNNGVVLNDHRKSELKELNRIQEMIYESASDENKVMESESENFVQNAQGITRQVSIPSGEITLRSKTFTDFVPRITAMTRSQVWKKSKRVHFEDDLEDSAVETETEAEALTDNSQAEAQQTNAEAQHTPNADDIDPVTVQEERYHRIAEVQGQRLCLCAAATHQEC